MRKTITLIMTFAGVLLFCQFAVAQSVNPLRITVDHPSVDWEVDAMQASDWGGNINLNGPVSGSSAWVNDGVTAPSDNDTWTQLGRYGCDSLVNGGDIDGRIAFISRGACEFGLKVLNAENQGSIAGIIVNRAPIGVQVGTHVDGLTWMGGGVNGVDVTVPALFITYEDRVPIGKLVDSENVNMTISAPFIYDVASAYAYSTPQDQIVPLNDIKMVIINRDTVTYTNVKAFATITDPGGGETVLSEVIDTLLPHTDASFANLSAEYLVTFDEGYTPADPGEYTVTFTAETPGGNSGLDSESASSTFRITTDYTFALDNGNVVNTGGAILNSTSYLDNTFIYNVGSIYRTGPNGATVTYASFGIANPDSLTADLEFTARIYDLDTDNDGLIDSLLAAADDPAAGTIVELDPATAIAVSAPYVFTGDEAPNAQLYLEFDNVALDPNGIYMLMIEHDGLEFDNFSPPAYTTAGGHGYPDYATTYKLGDHFEISGFEWWNDNTGGFPHAGMHPTVRMHLDGFEIVNTSNPLADASLNLTPNPAKDVIHLQLNLSQNRVNDLRISITDMMGRRMHQEVMQNVQNHQFTFNLSNYPAGTYFVQLQSETGLRTLKFVVAE
jgi:hypothetical protein